MLGRCRAALIALAILAAPGVSRAQTAAPTLDSSPSVMFGGGWYDFIHQRKPAAALELEYNSNARYWGFVEPFSGVMATSDQALYAFAGLGFEVRLTDSIFATPNAAFGVYDDGRGKKLGSTVEFRTGLNLDYRFDNGMRLGVEGHHISNAGIGDHNPGVEILEFTYSVPIDKF